MHPSYLSQDRGTVCLTSYLDDSGSHEPSPITVMGGPVMSLEASQDFGEKWSKLLYSHRVPEPLHMTDFVRPYGSHVGMYPELKIALFRSVVELIKEYKLYSLAIAVSQVDFRSMLSEDACKVLIGPYAMGFFSAILSNESFSSKSLLFAEQRIAYLIDAGFAFPDQLHSVHAAIIKTRLKQGKAHVIGAMTFDSDDRVPGLQAADVIAWSARRKETDGTLTDEFEPLLDLFDERHAQIPITEDAIRMLATPINNYFAMTGNLPSLDAVLR